MGAAVGSILGGTIGNQADHRNGTIYGSEQAATTQIIAESPPLPPPPQRQVVVYQRPAPTALWIEGHWEFDGRGYYWVDGRWEIPPPRYHHYVAPRWERRARGHVYIRGHWRL